MPLVEDFLNSVSEIGACIETGVFFKNGALLYKQGRVGEWYEGRVQYCLYCRYVLIDKR